MDDYEKTASWWKREGDMALCELCPHNCRIKVGSTGLCKVRSFTEAGKLVSLNYGKVSSIAIDPIEKKPLFHFLPGTSILSLGSVGCNMYCPFCQNWSISTWGKEVSLRNMTSSEIIETAKREGVPSVAFTYNEPFVGYEFIADAAPLLKQVGLKVVLVTNGLVCNDPLIEILPYIDAMNIDLKAFESRKYRDIGGDLEIVKNSIVKAYGQGVHVELAHLVVTGYNDMENDFREMVSWIESLSTDMVLHISRYFPAHKWNEPPTSPDLIKRFSEIAREKLNYVYIGNMPGSSSTYCRHCSRKIIERNGYITDPGNIDDKGRCVFCGTDNGIIL